MERRSPRFSAVPKAMASVLSLGPFTIDGGLAREGAGHCRGDSMGPFLAWPVPVDHPQGQRPILISQDVTHWPRRGWATGTPWSFWKEVFSLPIPSVSPEVSRFSLGIIISALVVLQGSCEN